MKTILMVIGGLTDIPEPTDGYTSSFKSSDINSIRTLANHGRAGSLRTVKKNEMPSTKNTLLSLLGYDLERGVASEGEIMEYGLSSNPALFSESFRYQIIPGFSGNGCVISPSPLARGIGKLAHLKDIDIYSPGMTETQILKEMTEKIKAELELNDFIFVFTDYVDKKAKTGDPEAKKLAIELIDHHLISPIADFIWRSDHFINLAITTDHITSWVSKKEEKGPVPFLIFSNDVEINEDSVDEESPNFVIIYHDPSALIRTLFTQNIQPSNLPF